MSLNAGLITCNGCFDGLHHGHMFFLGFCRALGDRLVIGINTDEYLRKHKRSNFLPQDQRARELMELGFIEDVDIFPEDNPIEFLKRRLPSTHCMGEEYRDRAIELPICIELGIRVVYVPRIGRWSSTLLKGKN